jgi:hypothetical protein
MTIVGCGPRVEPFPAKTPEQIKQLTDVTDGAVAVIRSPESEEALRQALAALSAASEQYRQHKEAILTEKNAEMIGCINSHAIEILDLPTMLEKRDQAASQGDETKAKRRNAMLWSHAGDVGGCAATSTMLLIDQEQRPEALKHGAVVIAEIYSTLTIFRAAVGLKVAPVLKDQIRTYESIVTKLGPEQPVQVVTDALPKLRATLATLE